MKCILIFILLVFCCKISICQNDKRLEELLGEYAEGGGEEDNYTHMMEELAELFENPLHFDMLDRNILKALPYLSDVQISCLLNCKDSIQKPDWEEVFSLISANQFQREILPLIILISDSSNQYNPKKPAVQVRLISSIWGNTEKPTGYVDLGEGAGYEGPPYGFRNRGQALSRDFSMKIIAESDPGENNFTEPDHWSAGIAVHPGRQRFKLFIGDYMLSAGMGIGFATKPVFKSWKAEPQLQIRQRTALSLHGGTDENRFLRGGAVLFSGKRISSRIFVSARDIDATVKNQGCCSEYVTGIYSSGLYRSVMEQQKKDAVYEEIHGAELDYSGNRFEAGSLVARISLSKSFINPNDDALFLNELSRFALWSRALIGNGMVMGEIAISTLGSLALSLAYSGFYKNGFSYLVAYEQVEPSYISHRTLVSSALIKSDGNQEGRLNILFQPRKKWGIQADLVINGVSDPLHDLKAIYKGRSRFFYYSNSLKGEWIIQKDPSMLKSSIKIKSKDLEKALNWQGEIGISSSDLSGFVSKPGTYLSTRVKFTCPGDKITAQTGMTLFTSQVNSGTFYIYEPDVYYGMSLPALSGTGSRVFFLIRYKIFKSFQFELKVSRVEYDDRKVIGTGNDKVLTNHKTSLKAQLVYRVN